MTEFLKKLPRKLVRYAIFAYRDDHACPPFLTEDQWLTLAEFYEQQPGFGGWENFAESWDVGIDRDINAKIIRADDYFWCSGADHFTVVTNPYAYQWRQAKDAHAKLAELAAAQGERCPPLRTLKQIIDYKPAIMR